MAMTDPDHKAASARAFEIVDGCSGLIASSAALGEDARQSAMTRVASLVDHFDHETTRQALLVALGMLARTRFEQS